MMDETSVENPMCNTSDFQSAKKLERDTAKPVAIIH